MNFIIPIILGSEKDITLAEKIQTVLNKFEVNSIIRICSAHKSCMNLLKIIKEYELNENVKVYITIAGKSNALSALIDGNTLKPVIASPPLNDSNIHDIYSTISMPSGISPLAVLGSENAALAAIKVCGLFNKELSNKIKDYKENMIKKLHINDVKNKYNNEKLSIASYTENNMTSDLNPLLSFTRNGEEIKITHLKNGKVRDMYEKDHVKNNLILYASDRLSAFNRDIAIIPYKGVVLNKVSNWWFEKTKHLVPNHIVNNDFSNRMVEVKKCTVFPIEFVMRSYLTGSTETSIWKNYEKGVRSYCGHKLPDDLIKNEKLQCNLLTPTTKSDRDELISEEEILNQNIMTQEHWELCKKYAYTLFEYGQKVSKENGLILVDTKYEFGLDEEGNVLLVDELHTPDSSRFWIEHNYKELFNKGKDPESIDKEVVRKWIKQKYDDPYDTNIQIEIPNYVITNLSFKYMQLYELITGETPNVSYLNNEIIIDF